MKRIIVFLSFFVSGIALTGQTSEKYAVSALQDSINTQMYIFPQEKIHLHTDRDMYIPGEKIWFKAYVTDALTHQTPTYSHYVYVELMNDADTLISRVMVRLSDDGMYHGHIFLSDLIPEGSYTLRAYTRFLENMGDDYFFKKKILIGNLPDASADNNRQGRRRTARVDYDVSFFPEGGNLLDRTFCKVAFKVLDKNGNSITLSGELTDEEGKVISTGNTAYAGMGTFSFIPEKGKKYIFKTKNSDGLEKKFTLPEAKDTYSICATFHNNNHNVMLAKAVDCPVIPLYLLVQSRGIVLYSALWAPDRNYISFPKDQLPAGVIQFLLLDTEMNPISERLVFNRTNELAEAVFTTDKAVYAKRDKVTTEIYIKNLDQTRPAGHLSISITDDGDIKADTMTTIEATLLLSSELKGHIESPAYYLQDHDDAKIALDLLMMTHGWRRYNIPETLKGNYAVPETMIEITKEITGDIKSLFLGRPVVDATVSMLSGDGGFGATQTDSAGHFGFYNFDFPDSASFFVQAKTPKGKDRVEMFLNRETFPLLKHAPRFILPTASDEETGQDDDFLKKAEQRAKYDEDLRLINLPEIVVTATRVAKRDEARLQYWANSSSDYTMYREEFEKRRASKVSDLLMMVPGIMVGGNGSIRIRGGSGTPLIIIDGMAIEGDEDALDYVMVDDLESIDVFKGASAAIFGTRGGNGVISLTTRIGDATGPQKQTKFNYAVYRPLGFQQPVEFYAPKYDTPEAKNLTAIDYRTTIFWKPDVVVTENGTASFDFYTADFTTTYSVVIEGLTENGEIVRQIEKIKVE